MEISYTDKPAKELKVGDVFLILYPGGTTSGVTYLATHIEQTDDGIGIDVLWGAKASMSCVVAGNYLELTPKHPVRMV